jgi:hypothetical protein
MATGSVKTMLQEPRALEAVLVDLIPKNERAPNADRARRIEMLRAELKFRKSKDRLSDDPTCSGERAS